MSRIGLGVLAAMIALPAAAQTVSGPGVPPPPRPSGPGSVSKNAPVNGVLVTVSVTDLLTRNAAERAAHAAAVAADQPFFRCIILARLGALSLRRGALPEALAEHNDLLTVADELGAWFYRFAARLGLAPGDDVVAPAWEALGRWQRVAGHPLYDREVTDAAQVAVRTLEGLITRRR